MIVRARRVAIDAGARQQPLQRHVARPRVRCCATTGSPATGTAGSSASAEELRPRCRSPRASAPRPRGPARVRFAPGRPYCGETGAAGIPWLIAAYLIERVVDAVARQDQQRSGSHHRPVHAGRRPAPALRARAERDLCAASPNRSASQVRAERPRAPSDPAAWVMVDGASRRSDWRGSALPRLAPRSRTGRRMAQGRGTGRRGGGFRASMSASLSGRELLLPEAA